MFGNTLVHRLLQTGHGYVTEDRGMVLLHEVDPQFFLANMASFHLIGSSID